MALSSIDDERRHVKLHKYHASGLYSTDFPGFYPGEDHSWNLDLFTRNVIVKVQRISARSCEFDIVGVDASIANALRRIIISEVPTITIDHVFLWDNTSVIADEVLSHRLGLVPLNVDPSLLEMREDDVATDRNTLVFRLKATCKYAPEDPENVEGSKKIIENAIVDTSQFIWEPQGEQMDIFRNNRPKATNQEIIIAKLRPGHKLDLEMHAVKGIGATHAKWCPVAASGYRTHPHIRITGTIPPASIPKFVSCFSPGVIGVRENEEGQPEPFVANARIDAVTREVLRHKEFQDKVQLSRIRDWFIFHLESEGPYAPERLLVEAVSVMRDKIAAFRQAVVTLEGTVVIDKGP